QTDGRAVWVGYYTTGDLACFKALGWPIPEYLIDLYAEHYCLINNGDGFGDGPTEKLGLLDALCHYGEEPSVTAAEKKLNRDLALEDRALTADEMAKLLAYNLGDARDTARLLLHITQDSRFNVQH